MTVWKKLENENQYAVAIYNYNGTGSVPHLCLEVGELVELHREAQHWYWGQSLRRDAVGAFPKSYVAARECQVDRCGDVILASAGGSGVVHDIAVTLREWLPIWKNMYITNDDRFKFMEMSMSVLMKLRAQAASGALPQDQLRKVSRTAVFTIDKGNRTLGMELAVRNTGGHLVDPLEMSSYRLNAMHEEASARIRKNMETTPSSPVQSTPQTRSYSICVRIHNFVCRMTDTAELVISLFDASQNRLTEHLLVKWPPRHLQTAQVVFTDLGSDAKKEKLFLVCHVVRIGSMDAQVDYRRSSVNPTSTPPENRIGMRRPGGLCCGEVSRHLAGSQDKHVLIPYFPCEKEKMDTLLKHVIANQRDLRDAKHSQGLWVTMQLVEGDLKQMRESNPHLVVGNTVVARKMGFPEIILPGDARNDLYVTLSSGSFSKGGGKSSERNIELCARVVDKNGDILPGVISIGAGVALANEYTSVVYYHDDKPRWQEVFKVCLNIETFKEAHLVFLCRHRSSNEAKDRAEKHFALSYLRLMQKEGTTTPDGLHDLCVYKLDSKRSSDVEKQAAAACLGLPARRDELPAQAERGLTRGVLSLVHKDTLTVATKLCSTKLTQRVEILGVLKWHTHHAEGSLREALTKLLHVPSEEIVKFLQDILDALFSILTQVEEDQEGYSDKSYAVLVLECLLHVLSLVADHKYQHFQPVLHAYIDQSFCDALAYEKLIAVIVWVITTADGGETKRLLQCMKCLECLVRIVARSRQLRAALGDRAATTDFKYQFESFLEALIWLMRCGEHALTCQGCALKYLPHAVPHAITVYPEADLSAYIVRALDALPLGRLSKQRMLALLELVKGPLCKVAAARALFLPHLAGTIRALLKDKAEWDREAAHKFRSVDKAARLLGADTSRIHDQTQHQQIVDLCVQTLGEVVSLLARDDVGPVEADRTELARRLWPVVLRTAASMMNERKMGPDGYEDHPKLRALVCVLIDMIRQLSEEQYVLVVRGLEAESVHGTRSLVSEAISLITTLIKEPVFKQHWADMLHLHLHVMMHALKLLSTTLLERLKSADESDTEHLSTIHMMWTEWFHAVVALATSPALQLETLSVARKQRVTALYGDLRQIAASTLADCWFKLDEHKRSFIPCLVGPFLEISFLRDDEVRNTTIPLFFDMMQTEYSSGDGDGQLKELESEFIDKIDVLAERGLGDVSWRARFVSLCGALCACAGAAQPAAALLAAAARQLDTLLQHHKENYVKYVAKRTTAMAAETRIAICNRRLEIEYRTAALRSATPHRMHLTTRVLHFYAQIERPHMYIRYVHKLAKMHREANQSAEAGLSLKLHAKLLSWSEDALPQRLRHPTADSDHLTHRDLKESLYLEIAELLDEGHQWELAVEVIKELVSVYEEEALGYAPLVELHGRLAKLYHCMLTKPRSHPGFFRVVYHGKGFPEHLRVPHGFVYRGSEYEPLQGFNERLLDEWPDAELLPKLDPPGEDITESDGKYLQINSVKPIMGDKMKRLSGKPVAEQILEYYKYNNVDRFEFDRPFDRPEELDGSTDDVSSHNNIKKRKNTFATTWLLRTELEISDTLPGILRWFPVINQKSYWLNPVEVAVDSLQGTNRVLKSVILASRAPDAPLKPLTLKLVGILDAAVQGGIENYEEAFLNSSYEAKHPENAAILEKLKDLIADQIPLLKFGLDVHGQRATPDLEKLHSHMSECFRKIKDHVHHRYGKKECDFEPETPEVQLRALNRHSANTDTTSTSNNRISDISTGNDSVTKSSKFFSLNSAMNPLARNSHSAVSKFGTLNTPRRRDKRRARKSEVGPPSGSQWYTSHSTPNGSATTPLVLNTTNLSLNVSTVQPDTPRASPLKELSQTLVTERPLRAEVERERRLSQRASILTNSAPPSNRDSMGTTDSNQDEEEPPPLPQKSSHRTPDIDIENNNSQDSTPLPPRYNYDTVFSPRGSFLYNSLAMRRNTNPTADKEKPPTPPPKKKNFKEH